MKKIILLALSSSFLILQDVNPEGVILKQFLIIFLMLLQKKNIDEVKKYITKDSEGMMGMMQMGMQNMPDTTQTK